MIKHILLGLFLSSTLLLSACSTTKGEENNAYHRISPKDAKEMMEQKTVTIVDVRTKEEYEEAHIPNAILIPNESIKDTQPEELPDKDAILLIYCRSGKRSKQASDKLVELGYANVYDFGGIIDWTYETESGEVE